jgi:hypothetical protein
MFPLPYPAPYSTLLYILFGLDLALLGGGLGLGRYDAEKAGRLPLAMRMGLSAILVLAAVLQWQLVGPPASGYGSWIFLGMTSGFLGDLIMAGLLPVALPLIGGMVGFGLGHLYYAVAFARMALALGVWDLRLALGVWVVAALVSIGLWHRFVRSPGGGILSGGALAYSLLMATMNALAISLAVRELRFLPLALGAVLFLASDLALGNWRIRGHKWQGVNDAIWVTYNLGQLLIVYSVAAALNAVPAS